MTFFKHLQSTFPLTKLMQPRRSAMKSCTPSEMSWSYFFIVRGQPFICKFIFSNFQCWSKDLLEIKYQKIFKNGIHSFPVWRLANGDSVKSKPASLLVVSLGKALNGMPPPACGKQVVGPSSLPVVVAQSDERHANRS